MLQCKWHSTLPFSPTPFFFVQPFLFFHCLVAIVDLFVFVFAVCFHARNQARSPAVTAHASLLLVQRALFAESSWCDALMLLLLVFCLFAFVTVHHFLTTHNRERERETERDRQTDNTTHNTNTLVGNCFLWKPSPSCCWF